MSEGEFGVESPGQTGPGLASSPDWAPGLAWELHRKRKRSDSPYKGATKFLFAAAKASWGLTVPPLSTNVEESKACVPASNNADRWRLVSSESFYKQHWEMTAPSAPPPQRSSHPSTRVSFGPRTGTLSARRSPIVIYLRYT